MSREETLSDNEEDTQSDADKLLNQHGNKRQKVVNDDNINGSDGTKGDHVTDDPLLEEIAQAMNEGEQTDPKIAEQLAKIINLRWLNKLNEEQLRQKLDKHLRPVNCERLITPKVNLEVWGRLDRETRNKDLKLSYLQTNLAVVGNITAKTTEGSCRERRPT